MIGTFPGSLGQAVLFIEILSPRFVGEPRVDEAAPAGDVERALAPVFESFWARQSIFFLALEVDVGGGMGRPF